VSPGTYNLSVADQGYYPLGTAPDGTLIPVSVNVRPGLQQLPGGESYAEGWSVLVGLAAEQPAPTISLVVPPDGTTNSKVTVHGTGLLGTYSVMFGTQPATSYTVNTAGTRITAYAPFEPAGPVSLVVTTLGGSAQAIFAYT